MAGKIHFTHLGNRLQVRTPIPARNGDVAYYYACRLL